MTENQKLVDYLDKLYKENPKLKKIVDKNRKFKKKRLFKTLTDIGEEIENENR